MKRKKPTIADLRALKGKGQLTMLKVTTLEEAAAAEEAGIDIVSLPEEARNASRISSRRTQFVFYDG